MPLLLTLRHAAQTQPPSNRSGTQYPFTELLLNLQLRQGVVRRNTAKSCSFPFSLVGLNASGGTGRAKPSKPSSSYSFSFFNAANGVGDHRALGFTRPRHCSVELLRINVQDAILHRHDAAPQNSSEADSTDTAKKPSVLPLPDTSTLQTTQSQDKVGGKRRNTALHTGTS